MSLEENKAVVFRLVEAWNTGNMTLFDDILSPDYTDHDALQGQAQGLEGYKQIGALYLSIFPDLNITINEMIAEGDKVAVMSTLQGTHQGEFMGMAPTGKQVTATAINIYRIANNKLVEEWSGSRRSSTSLVEQLQG